MRNQSVDILIIGGGLIGAALLLSLKELGYSALLVESKSFKETISPDFDARSLALSPASVRILSTLGLWDHLKEHATFIEMIHVSAQHHFGATRLQGDAQNPLGYVIEMHHINHALHQMLNTQQLLAPASLISLNKEQQEATIQSVNGKIKIKAQLIVAADGAESTVRQLCKIPVKIKYYNQQAIVANVALARAHQNKAFERFTTHGPLALLPMQDKKMSLVWALPPEQCNDLLALNDNEFLKKLQNEFGYRLGRMTKIGKRVSFPLKQVITKELTQWPLVFVGNAAQTLHPVAAHGFNLGLRDVATLAQCIAELGLQQTMLQRYLHLRRPDQRLITKGTDGLIGLFTSRLPGIGLMRNLGLIALDNSPLLKELLARYAKGFGGVVPDLVCELPLNTKEENS